MAPVFRIAGIAAARTAHEKKGENVILFHAGETNPLADYILLVTALSRPHLETLEGEVARSLRLRGLSVIHRAKPETPAWRVLDLGGLIVHIQTAHAREFYALDKLFLDARPVRWEQPPGDAPTPRRRAQRPARAAPL